MWKKFKDSQGRNVLINLDNVTYALPMKDEGRSEIQLSDMDNTCCIVKGELSLNDLSEEGGLYEDVTDKLNRIENISHEILATIKASHITEEYDDFFEDQGDQEATVEETEKTPDPIGPPDDDPIITDYKDLVKEYDEGYADEEYAEEEDSDESEEEES